MIRKTFNALMIVALVLGATATLGFAQTPPTREAKSIGSLVPASKRLVAPKEADVIQELQVAGTIDTTTGEAEVQAAVDAYYADFFKKQSDWINPEAQAFAEKHDQELANASLQADPAVVPVKVSIFALAVDFGGINEAMDIYRANAAGTDCVLTSAGTYTGPMQGEIVAPPATDTHSLYYPPLATADTTFYNNMIFGYEGAGVVRPELRDPQTNQFGIDLRGYTVQDYYDHVAGKGNVALEGAVEGWVTVDHPEAYYGAPLCVKLPDGSLWTDNDGGAFPVGATPEYGNQHFVGQLVVDALTKFQTENPTYFSDTSSTAFWPQFDGDKDGVLDTMWIIHAGDDEAAGGGAEGDLAIWSHSWSLGAQGLEFQVYEGDPATDDDDIWVEPYTMQPENPDLGVMVEEFGHNFFGLPDLYTTDVENSIGFWSEMAGGSWAGKLAGSNPVGMPLWFRMIAQCGGEACNWQYPMITRDYKDPAGTYTLGAIDGFTPAADGSVVKGVRVNLPPVQVTYANRTGAANGKGAWTNTGVNNADQELVLNNLAVPATGSAIFSFDTYYDIEYGYDYGFVGVKKAGDTEYTFLNDVDGNFMDLGGGTFGLTGKHVPNTPFNMKFDLSAYKGQTISIGFLYQTDAGVANPGWWIDNVKLDDTLVTDFETAVAPATFPANWVNASEDWVVVPYTASFTNYYLVEWRAETKYDQWLKTAYQYLADGVNVDTIPYNLPGALVYFRDTRYGSGYSQFGYYTDAPSFGPKNKLLIVDMHPEAMRLIDQNGKYVGSMNNRRASYDAALTLQPTQAFDISSIFGLTTPYVGPFHFDAKPAVSTFNDTKGYYPGFYMDPVRCPPAGSVCYSNRDGSVVIPARGKYTVRIADFSDNPLYEFFGYTVSGSVLGTGNPGENNVQHGVNIDLLSKSADEHGTQGTLTFRNYSVDMESSAAQAIGLSGEKQVRYTTKVTNTGTQVAKNIVVTYTLDPLMVPVAQTCPEMAGGATPQGMVKVCNIPTLAPGASIEVTLTGQLPAAAPASTDVVAPTVFTKIEGNDGQIMRGPWFFETTLNAVTGTFLPFLRK